MDKKMLRSRVAEVLKAAQSNAGLTGARIAELMDNQPSQSLISRYTRGRVLPSLERLRAMLALCGDEPPQDIIDGYKAIVAASPNQGQLVPGYRRSGTQDMIKFVETWQTSESEDEVAEKLKLKPMQVRYRVNNCRRNGVPLKKMPRRNRKEIDWAAVKKAAKLPGLHQGAG